MRSTRHRRACIFALTAWRQGHFRMQTHGIRHQERKLIFVAPMMVRADLFPKEVPTPKIYRAR